jgi:curved DNA-binding protein CbpA
LSDTVTRMSDAPGKEEADSKLENVELDPELRQAVVALYGRLDSLDYYGLLGVDRTIDRKAIKRAYYELASKFHPDRHFRKKLGSFKVKMEAIFARATLAHDTLVDGERRAEYDQYLQAQRQSRSIEDLLSDAVAHVREVEANAEREVLSSVPPKLLSVHPAPRVDVAARREALARRLRGGWVAESSNPAARTSQKAPSSSEAVDALRRRYEERVLQAKAAQARTYAEKAKDSAAAGDFVAAASSLRIASGLVPSNVELARMAKDAQARADVLLGQTYTQQAEYEEKNGHWSEASRSWTRVCRARDTDARAHERAANAIVKASGDLHEAARLGTRACELDPANALARLTLANVYLAAGLGLNARRELEAAARLAPRDDTIQEMIKKLGQTA